MSDLWEYQFRIEYRAFTHEVTIEETVFDRAELRAKRIAYWAWMRNGIDVMMPVHVAVKEFTATCLHVEHVRSTSRRSAMCVSCLRPTSGARWCSDSCRITEDGPQDEDFRRAGFDPPHEDDEYLEMGS